MAETPSGRPVAVVRLWGRRVAAVAEDAAGTVTFEFDEDFRRSGLEVSPLRLPLSRGGPMSFPELRRKPAFDGLPGLLADSLPDDFGNRVIRRYFEQRGNRGAELSPVQRLLYLGSRAMGALEFEPAYESTEGATSEALDVAVLVSQARSLVEGDAAAAIPEIMRVGGSAGGARAKALILWNSEANRVRSGFAAPEAGDEPWIIKFDGVQSGSGGPAADVGYESLPYGRTEYVYSVMARAAGIEMEPTHLMEERGFGHFMTRRFDRPPGGKLHMHSLGGMQHVDFHEQFAYSYEDYFRTIRALHLGQPALNEAYRRMVFSFATLNRDDHVKNISFLMDREGHWRLAPAYDVAYAAHSPWTRQHQMSANGKHVGFTRKDLLDVGARFDVPHGGREIVERVLESLTLWTPTALASGLGSEWTQALEGEFVRFQLAAAP
ncbi:MAG: type II toxin-antitoxin system HipA family toxin [Gemmatimonadota bacterium]|nr:MAG: type II toxin-antitoxin system HipA family toxin [Gemmatimonadota bacterium]